MRFEVDDPMDLARTAGMGDNLPNVVLGLRTTDGGFHGARLKEQPAGRCIGKMAAPEICEEHLAKNRVPLVKKDYEVVVPTRTPLVVWVYAPRLSILDQAGSRLSGQGAHGALNLAQGITTYSMRLRVAGLSGP
ncbi:MAG: hypothetical protein IT164_15395 [Bryobacterales bacterium]|nr:hypothetical protein [Bryobacterales bacterium]